MKKILFGLTLIFSISTFAFTDGLTYKVKFEKDGGDDSVSRVVISDIKYKGKDIYALTDVDRDVFAEKICDTFNGVSRSSGMFFDIFVTGKDGQVFKSNPLEIPIQISINNPMGIITNGNLEVRKVINETISTTFSTVVCEIEKKSSWF